MSSEHRVREVDRLVSQAMLTGDYVNLPHAIEARLKHEPDEAARRSINFALARAYRFLERYGDSESIYLLLHRQTPDEPLPLIALAEQKLYDENDPAAAMTVIDRALEAASRSNNFRRVALGVKARIALEQKNFSVVEDVIRRLLELRHDRRGADIGREQDFFDRLPAGAIDGDLAREFDQYSRPPPKPGQPRP